MGVLEEMSDLISANALGTPGTDLFLRRMPPAPDACTAIYLTGGRGPEYTLENAAQRYEATSIKIMVRSDREKNYKAAEDKAYQIWILLGAVQNQNLTGTGYSTRYLWIVPIQSPFSLGPDENNRMLVVANYD